MAGDALAFFNFILISEKEGGEQVKFFNTGKTYDADEIGVLKMDLDPKKELASGDVGYIISGIKKANEVKKQYINHLIKFWIMPISKNLNSISFTRNL